MAASYTCDGCGAPVAVPHRVGHVLKRDYCDDCKVIAEGFLTDEETLRESVQMQFLIGRKSLADAVREKLKLLPDVVEHG